MLRFPVDRSNRAALLSLTLSLQLLDVVDSTEHMKTGKCARFHSSSGTLKIWHREAAVGPVGPR